MTNPVVPTRRRLWKAVLTAVYTLRPVLSSGNPGPFLRLRAPFLESSDLQLGGSTPTPVSDSTGNPAHQPPGIMEPLTPQVMHKLVFTILVHGLPDAQTNVAYEILLEAQNNPNPQVRELAVVALTELPVPAAKRVAALAKGMRDAAARVRRRAARALGDFGVHALPAVPVLTNGLKDADTSVRRDSAGTPGRLGPAAAPAAANMVNLLAEPDTRSRVVAATALKRIGRTAVPALLDGLRGGAPDVHARIAAVLTHIAPNDSDVTTAIRMAEAEDARCSDLTSTCVMPALC